MVDKEMLVAMEDLLDRKMLTAMEDLLDRKLDEKLDEKLDQKFDEKLKPINDKLEKLDGRVTNLETSMKDLQEGMEKLDKRTSKLEADMTYVKVDLLENNVIPRLNTIEKCYVDTSKRYLERTDQIDRIDLDVSVLKQVVTRHSEQLKRA